MTLHHRTRARPRGFTILELVVALAVLGTIAALAFPSFQSALMKSRRSEALTALGAAQLKQERWRANNTSYASDLTGTWPANGLALSSSTPGQLYTIAIAANSETGYELTATANAGTSQVRDGNCAVLGVRMEAGNLSYGSAAAGAAPTYSATNPCWSR